MEALWNYFYWQTLSINLLDDTSHMLRASLTAAPDCLNFRNTPPQTEEDRKTFERCNAYLGPNQPGIFSPDPLDDGGNPSAAALRAASGRPAERLGEQRGEGQPEAGPLPGQPTCRVPGHAAAGPPRAARLAPPRAGAAAPSRSGRARGPDAERLQNRLDQVLPQVAPQAPSDTTGQLLDFLLAP